MRRKTTNKKVLQAISIGLSAMIAVTSTPVDVIAADNPDENTTANPEPVVETSTQATNVADGAQTAAENAAGAVDNVFESNHKQDTITSVNEAAEAVDNAGLKHDDTLEVLGSTVPGETYTDVLEGKADLITGSTDNKGDLTTPSGVITGTEGIKDDLGDAELFDAAANGAESAAGTKTTELGNVAADLNQATGQTAANIQAGVDTIQNATTTAGVQAAYDALVQAAAAANTNFDTQLAEYNSKKAEYEKLKADLEQYEKAYNTEVDAAKTGAGMLVELNDDGIVKTDQDGNVIAKGTLADAKAKLDELKKAADDAAANLNQNAQNMLEVARLIDKNQNDSGVNWQGADGLRETFKKIMVYYYLPKAGLEGVTSQQLADLTPKDIITVSGKDKNGKTDNTKTYHYIKIGDVRYCFNYKLLDGKNGTEIVIFEKRAQEIDGAKIEFDGFDEYADENGKKVTIDSSVVEADSTSDADTDPDCYVQIKEGAEGHTESLVGVGTVLPDNDNDATTQTRIEELVENTEQVSYVYDEKNGVLVKTVTQGATTVVYKQKT
ncbi:MAG: hypothetical protein Q4G60_01640, partial [bacterium]|nr:hypothetical protein [bacterium]